MAYVRTEHKRLKHTDGRVRARRGSGSGGSGKKRMAKATLKPQAQVPIDNSIEEPEDSNAKLMRQMKARGVTGTNFRIRERDDLD